MLKFPHADSVAKLSLSAFKAKFQSWCKKSHYNYNESKATKIHAYARTLVSTLPMTESAKTIVSELAKDHLVISILYDILVVLSRRYTNFFEKSETAV